MYTSIEQNKKLAQFSDNYIWQLNTSIKEATRNFLLPAKNIAKLGAYMFEQKLISLDNSDSLATFVYPFIESYPQFNGYFVGNEQKEFWFWHNAYTEEYAYRIQTIKQHDNAQLIEQKNYLSANRQKLKLSTPLPPTYDPTTRLWYKGAKALASGFWSDVYSFSLNENVIPGITASYPIYDKNNKLLGVFGVDIVLKELSNFLYDVGSSRATELVIFNEQEKVIAYSGFKKVSIKNKLVNLNDLNQPIIEKALLSYKKHGFSEFYFSSNGTRYLASYSSFLFGEEKDWRLLLVVPQSELSSKVGENTYFIFIFSLLVFIISLIQLVYLIRQPLQVWLNNWFLNE